MAKELNELSTGIYVCDIRADEGVRIREDAMSPCLHRPGGGYLTNIPLVIEVKKSDKNL